MLRLTISLLIASSAAIHAEVDAEIPLGVEVVTGYRSALVERGFELGKNVLDVQIQSELALNDEWSMGFGALHARASDSGNYEETQGFLEIRRDVEAWSYGWSLGYRDVSSDIWQSGIETGPFVAFGLNDDWDVNASLVYDDGASGWYGDIGIAWSHALNDKSFVSFDAAMGVVSGYYERNGLHDVHARLGLTYKVAANVSFTPFIGSSIGLHDDANDKVFGGLWFEVTF